MFAKVLRLFRGKTAVAGLALAGLVVLSALVAAPSSAAAATGEVTTTHWKEGTNDGFVLDATVVTDAQLGLATVTMTGPGLATAVQLTADTSGATYTASATLSARPTVGAAYTISVSYLDNPASSETLSPKVTNVIDVFPTPTAPVGAVASSAAPTFRWTAPATMPANFSVYGVSLTGASVQWSADGLTTTNAAYTGAALASATPYQWSLFMVDNQGNKSEIRTSFQVGINFKGKVTDINGIGLGGVAVDVSDAIGNVFPTVLTEADGTYMYGGLPTGSYKIAFSTDTASVFFNNRLGNNSLDQADWLPLTKGVLTTGVNAVLGGWGAITGSVYLQGGTPPAAGVLVTLVDSAGTTAIASVPPVTILSGGTASYANFYLGVIKPGNYRVKLTAAGYAPYLSPVVTIAANVTSNVAAIMTSGMPTITEFTVPATSTTFTVTGIKLVASEVNGVGGYLLTESPTTPTATQAGWTSYAPTAYTFTGGTVGQRKLYAWAKGTSGVVSASVLRTVLVTVAKTVTVTASGPGTGTVYSTPTGIACATGSTSGCSASFAGGSSVTLTPSASISSVFGGWTGACTGTGNCVITVDNTKTVGASFAVKTATVKIDGSATAYYQVGAAFDAGATATKTVRAKADTFVENVVLTGTLPVLFKGGYTDDAFTARGTTSVSVIDGSLKVRGGALRVERLKIR